MATSKSKQIRKRMARKIRLKARLKRQKQRLKKEQHPLKSSSSKRASPARRASS